MTLIRLYLHTLYYIHYCDCCTRIVMPRKKREKITKFKVDNEINQYIDSIGRYDK